MAGARAKWRMLFGILFLLGAGVLVLTLMAILELVSPRAGPSFSNGWWYAMVKFWKEGGAVVLHQSSYTTLPHFAHTDDFEIFDTFDPPMKRRRFLPPPLFTGRITIRPRWALLKAM